MRRKQSSGFLVNMVWARPRLDAAFPPAARIGPSESPRSRPVAAPAMIAAGSSRDSVDPPDQVAPEGRYLVGVHPGRWEPQMAEFQAIGSTSSGQHHAMLTITHNTSHASSPHT